ncbi:hypothetical protein JCM33774_78440 [Actinophytocola sp. KF-1]
MTAGERMDVRKGSFAVVVGPLLAVAVVKGPFLTGGVVSTRGSSRGPVVGSPAVPGQRVGADGPGSGLRADATGLASGPRLPAYGRGPTVPGPRRRACGQVAPLWTTP